MSRTSNEAEDLGDGYFASISDLMVGILFVFLLMLAVFAIRYADEDKDQVIEDLKKQVATLTNERDGLLNVIERRDIEIARLSQRLAELIRETNRLREEIGIRDTEIARLRDGIVELAKELEHVSVGLRRDQGEAQIVRQELLETLKNNLERRDVKVELDASQGILRLSSQSLFVLDRSDFTAIGKDSASVLLEEMSTLLPCYARPSEVSKKCDLTQPIFETVLIEGHTDTLPTERRGGNWTLSTDPARAFLELMSVSASSLRDLRNSQDQPLIGLAGYGDSRPLPNIPGWDERNRRIEVRFLLSGERNLQRRVEHLNSLVAKLREIAGRQ
jgi:flagellar motor protein MotB